MTRKKLIIASLFFMLIGGGGYRIFSQKTPDTLYTSINVTRTAITEAIQATGIIKPAVGAEVKVGARISGTVITQRVRVGDIIQKGELIAIIDPRELGESLKITQASLAEIEGNYPKKIAAESKKIEAYTSALTNAKSNLEYATFVYKQKEELYHAKRRFVSEEEYKKAKNSFDNAQSSLKQAELDLEAALLNHEALISEYKAKKVSSSASVSQKSIQLGYSRIFSPLTGIVSYVSTQEGETVIAGLNAPEFVKILNPKRLENRIYIDETEIGKVKVGQEVNFRLDTYKNKIFNGRVTQIYPTPTMQNNIVYFTVVVETFNNGELVRPDMTTHNNIILSQKKGVLALPNRAVKWKEGKFIVFMKQNGEIIEKTVTIGLSDDKMTEILSGVNENDEVFVAQTAENNKTNGKKETKGH